MVPYNKNDTILWAVWIPAENYPIIHNESYILEVVCNNSIGFQLSHFYSVSGNITIPLTGLTGATTYTCAVFGDNRTELLSSYSTTTTWGGNGKECINCAETS